MSLQDDSLISILKYVQGLKVYCTYNLTLVLGIFAKKLRRDDATTD